MYASIRERRSEEGFTLIELLVVMIIIAILMAVAVPTFLAQKNSAQKTKATANIKQIVNAIEACAANITTGAYADPGPPAVDCTNFTNLKTYEKGLVPLAAGTGVGQYNITPVASGGSTVGYAVKTVIQDGQTQVAFVEHHAADGGLYKMCGASGLSPTATVGAAVAGSRTCTNGRWG
jgi:prepilin-type N-terminal cleavage/methylation domain-containing protein